MKHSSITADTTSHLLHEDGSTTAISALAELLVIEIKGHGHIGNVMHHVSRGDWAAVDKAVRELLAMPYQAGTMSPLARNLVTMLHGTCAPNLRPFRPWLLQHIECRSTSFYRKSLELRLDLLAEQILSSKFVFTKSAARILHEAR